MKIFNAGQSISTGTLLDELKEADALLVYSNADLLQMSQCVAAASIGKPIVLLAVGPSLDGIFDAASLIIARQESLEQVHFIIEQCLPLTCGKQLLLEAPIICELLRSAASPIEKRLAVFMHAMGIPIVAQHPVGRYRLDFACVDQQLAIEADGHDFHERTKEQARHDKSRDRELQLLGWQVVRFTGSEIHENALHCAHQVLQLFNARSKVPA